MVGAAGVAGVVGVARVVEVACARTFVVLFALVVVVPAEAAVLACPV